MNLGSITWITHLCNMQPHMIWFFADIYSLHIQYSSHLAIFQMQIRSDVLQTCPEFFPQFTFEYVKMLKSAYISQKLSSSWGEYRAKKRCTEKHFGIYCIAGNIRERFILANLANWQNSPNIKLANYNFMQFIQYTELYMAQKSPN